MRLDHHAMLHLLLSATGLSQTEASKLLGVAPRTVRRWAEGVQKPSDRAMDHLASFARGLDYAADHVIQGIDLAGSTPFPLLVYRKNEDVPPWSGFRTAGAHLAMLRRVAERRPDVSLISFNRGAYRRWREDRLDTEALRNEWARAQEAKAPIRHIWWTVARGQ